MQRFLISLFNNKFKFYWRNFKEVSNNPRVTEKLSGRFQDATSRESHTRKQMLQSQLRLAHIKEGEEEIRQICAEYMDVWPGDRLTLQREGI